MNKLKRTTFKDRFKNAVKAFEGKQIGSVEFGVEVKRCDQCEYRGSNPIRDNFLVTAGARAAYMHDANVIKLPEGLEGEDELAYFIMEIVDYYYNELVDVNFDEYVEEELSKKYGGQNG